MSLVPVRPNARKNGPVSEKVLGTAEGSYSGNAPIETNLCVSPANAQLFRFICHDKEATKMTAKPTKVLRTAVFQPSRQSGAVSGPRMWKTSAHSEVLRFTNFCSVALTKHTCKSLPLLRAATH